MIKNIKEAKALIKRYNSITLKEIENDPYQYRRQIYRRDKANSLTGFGETRSCTLCQSVLYKGNIYESPNCKKCIHSISCPKGFPDSYKDCACLKNNARKTYYAIRTADTAKALQAAFRNRAKYLQSLIDQYESSKNKKS